jgi:hypothetical protein
VCEGRLGLGRSVLRRARLGARWSFAQSFLLRLPTVGDNAAMQAEPSTADPPERKRRWFQFSLRTLLIGVTLVAIAAWYVRSEANFVNERKELASYLAAQSGAGPSRVTFASDWEQHLRRLKWNVPFRAGSKTYNPPFPRVSFLREWLGDDFALVVEIYGRRPEAFMKRLKAAFPEAEIIVNFE